MAQGVVVKDDVKKVLKSLRELAATKVLVGIPQEKNTRKSDPVTNAALGYIHEHGAPEANIPARPFLVPGVRSAKTATVSSFKKAGQAALSGQDFKKHLVAVGLRAVSAVRKKITDGPFIPLKPGTIAGRRRQGFTGTKPLIRTGQLRNAVTFVIRKKR